MKEQTFITQHDNQSGERPSLSSLTIFRRLLSLAAPFHWWIALSALIGFLTIVSSIGLMSSGAWIIATAALHPPIGELQLAIVGVRFFGISRGVFRYLERLVSHETTFRLLARLRVWAYRALEPLAPARVMNYRSGDLLSRVVSDVETLENFYLRVLAPPLIAALVIVAMTIFFALQAPALGLVLATFLLATGVLLPLFTRTLGRRAGIRLIGTRAALNAALIDGIQGLADLIAYGRQDHQRGQIHELSQKLARQQTRMARIAGVDLAMTSLATSLAVIAVLAVGTPLVRAGSLDGVMLAVLALATITTFEAVQPLPAAFQHLDSNLEAARRLFQLVDTPPTVTAPANPRPLPGDHELAVENLRFRYAPDDPPALDGISFRLRPGSTVAVVGPSGAGKTSLINLLLRFWDYTEGRITLGGQDLRALDPDEARTRFSVVSQNTYLFNGTIRDNLLVARASASDADLQRAIDSAQLGDFVAQLPDGLDTWIGEHGLGLSGGERQRLAVARAILKDAPILILDEATANLDAVTEQAVLHALQTAMRGRSTLIITHRLVGLEDAAEILVLHQGRIVESGQHHELLQVTGRYRRMWDLQQQILPVEQLEAAR